VAARPPPQHSFGNHLVGSALANPITDAHFPPYTKATAAASAAAAPHNNKAVRKIANGGGAPPRRSVASSDIYNLNNNPLLNENESVYCMRRKIICILFCGKMFFLFSLNVAPIGLDVVVDETSSKSGNDLGYFALSPSASKSYYKTKSTSFIFCAFITC
jgi:hypothetical protein